MWRSPVATDSVSPTVALDAISAARARHPATNGWRPDWERMISHAGARFARDGVTQPTAVAVALAAQARAELAPDHGGS